MGEGNRTIKGGGDERRERRIEGKERSGERKERREGGHAQAIMWEN